MTTGSRLRLQLIGTAAGEAASRLAQLGSVALVGWMLGVTALGIVGLAWSLTTIVLALIQGGPELAGVRDLVQAWHEGGEERAAKVVAEVTRFKLCLAAAAVPLLILVGAVFSSDTPGIVPQLAIQTAAMLLTGTGYIWVFRSLWRSLEQGGLRALQAVGSLALLWPLLTLWPSPLMVPTAEVIAAGLALVLGRVWLGGLVGTAAPEWPAIRRFAGPSLRLGFTTVLATVCWLAPILIAARAADLEQVSYLTGTLRLIIGVSAVLQILLQALYPALARLYGCDAERGLCASMALILLSLAATVAGLAILMPFADWIVPTILGPGFAEAGPLFGALLPLMVPIAITSPVNYALMARGESAVLIKIQIVVTLAMVFGSAAAFAINPTAWNALVFHPVLWGQTVLTLTVAWRQGVIGRPANGWRVLRDPWLFARLIREPPPLRSARPSGPP